MWFLPVQLCTDVHPRCAKLLRSDAVRLEQFRAIHPLLCRRHEQLLWFLPVQLRTDVHSRCAKLLRSDAVRLEQFRAIHPLLCRRHE